MHEAELVSTIVELAKRTGVDGGAVSVPFSECMFAVDPDERQNDVNFGVQHACPDLLCLLRGTILKWQHDGEGPGDDWPAQ